MPRARSPNRDKAKELWLASGKKRLLKDIAAELGVAETKVRKWKSEDKWETKKDTVSNGTKGSAAKGNAPKRHKGGQPGNKNAVGNNGGAPLGNKNAFKHGGYSRIYWDTLDEEEQEMIEAIPKDEEELLIEQIQLFSIRERRLMKAIAHYKGIQGGFVVDEVVSTKTVRDFGKNEEKKKADEALYEEMIQKKIASGDRLPGNSVTVTTKTEAIYNIVQSLERNLTDIQARKTKCIDSLAKLRIEREKDGNGRVSEVVDDWISAILGKTDGETGE